MNESLIFFNIDTCMEHRNLLLSMAWNGLRHLPWAVFSKVTLKLVFWLVCWWYIPIQPGSRSMCNSELSNTEKSTRSVVMMPMGSLEQYLCVAHSQRLFQFLPALLNLAVEISAHSLLRPRLMIKFSSAFFLWVSNYISHHLKIPALGSKKVLDVSFGIFGETQHEITLYF